MASRIKKVYLIAGEASGDLHGSNLIRAMQGIQSELEFRCWGGDECEKAGGKLVKHIKDLAFMGFVEVLFNLRTILSNIQFCKEDILQYHPDVLILIDYPGFNLRIAEWAKEKGFRVVYYISPQIWAWKESRVKKIKKVVDQMLVILPFERDFYSKHGMQVSFVGHPLLDVVDSYVPHHKIELVENKPLVALLPGSRLMEIRQIWPIFLEVVKRNPNYRFILAMAPTLSADQFEGLGQLQNLEYLKGSTYDILNSADAALVTSGTATLETALFGVPEVVCYKGNSISYFIARNLIKVKYISLVNLILDKLLVTELIQFDLEPEKLDLELRKLLQESSKEYFRLGYTELKGKLGEKGASQRAASEILK